jgi:hypothetical protein
MMGIQKREHQLFRLCSEFGESGASQSSAAPGKSSDRFFFVREEVAHCYGHNGNESVPPEVILKMMFLLFFDDIKSERELMEVIGERLVRCNSAAVRIVAKIVGLALAVYLVAFVWCFDVFSSPVRNNKHRWLGPLIRGDTHSVDIGKTYEYESDNLFYYRTFWPLCKVWLHANGL